MKNYSVDYFLGANTPCGFVSLFDELRCADDGSRCLIIKGGPGTGKSTLMKSVADRLEKSGLFVERIHCSSDPESLDAIRCREISFSIADGTAPHVLEPMFPGAVESIINLGQAWDEGKLRLEREKIVSLTRLISACHARSVRFLNVAQILTNDNRRLSEDAVDREKLSLYVKRFLRRNTRSKTKNGRETRLLLSAVTPEGVVFFPDTVRRFATEIIEIDDPVGLVSSLLVGEIRALALKNGLDVITSFCPLNPDAGAEHIILPEHRIAFIRRHKLYSETPATRTIHASRFLDKEKIASRKQRLAFNRKVSNDMINEAVNALKQAKELHDELEKIYISAMDYEKLDEIKRETIDLAGVKI